MTDYLVIFLPIVIFGALLGYVLWKFTEEFLDELD